MRTITIIRQRGYYGAIRSLRLFVDGKYIAGLRQGQSMIVPIPPESEVLVGRVDWARTEEFPLQSIQDGDTLLIMPWFTLNPLRLWGIQKMPFHICKRSRD